MFFDNSVWSYPDGGTNNPSGLFAVQDLLAKRIIILHNALVGVAQQLERQLILGRKPFMRSATVRGNSEDDSVTLADFIPYTSEATRVRGPAIWRAHQDLG